MEPELVEKSTSTSPATPPAGGATPHADTAPASDLSPADVPKRTPTPEASAPPTPPTSLQPRVRAWLSAAAPRCP
ncbi:hypothetical protein [Streptomyces sp. NBC_01483]|uniref:hypothetical protein n=1 Tax=Streptomyces sp. NBC_01483 TaxID=2903883 RepID=UPI002E2F5A8F|nr:hypothetical protein [Streptomyces sp. NBC_01483]